MARCSLVGWAAFIVEYLCTVPTRTRAPLTCSPWAGRRQAASPPAAQLAPTSAPAQQPEQRARAPACHATPAVRTHSAVATAKLHPAAVAAAAGAAAAAATAAAAAGAAVVVAMAVAAAAAAVVAAAAAVVVAAAHATACWESPPATLHSAPQLQAGWLLLAQRKECGCWPGAALGQQCAVQERGRMLLMPKEPLGRALQGALQVPRLCVQCGDP